MGKKCSSIRVVLEKYSFLWFVILPFLFVVMYVNPIRYGFRGDDWAYARVTENLFATGEYHEDASSGANMPFLAYWGALFMRLLGQNHASLYISALVLWLFGLMGFFHLAKEYNFDNIKAGILTLFLLSSPLVVKSSFTFGTDVPFLALIIISVSLYTRAIRLHSYKIMFLASVLAAATIFTRQFGMILVAGLFLLWLLDIKRKEDALFYIVSILLPALAIVWQLYNSAVDPSWGTKYHIYVTSEYHTLLLENPLRILKFVILRLTYALFYLVLFCPPLACLALLDFLAEIRRWRSGVVGKRKQLLNSARIALIVTFIVAGVCLRFREAGSDIAALLLPYIEWDFRFDVGEAILITPLAAIGSIFISRILILHYLNNPGWKTIPANRKIFDYSVAIYVLILMGFYKLGDRYLLPLIPYSLLVLGMPLSKWLVPIAQKQSPGSTTSFFRAHGPKFAYAITIIVLLVSSISTRTELNNMEARWETYDRLLSSGSSIENVTDDWAWQSYHGAFDEFAISHTPEDGMKAYYVWLRERYKRVDPEEATP